MTEILTVSLVFTLYSRRLCWVWCMTIDWAGTLTPSGRRKVKGIAWAPCRCIPQSGMFQCPLAKEDCVFLSFSQGPSLSEPAVDCVPPYILLQVDCTTVCQKYVQRYNAKYDVLTNFFKKRIHTNSSWSPPPSGITNQEPDFLHPFF